MIKVLDSYTTQQAVQDGVLIAVEHAAYREAGIKFPVYFTSSAYSRYVEVPRGMESYQDLSGRLWDVLFMFAFQARKSPKSIMHFQFVCQIPADTPMLDNEKNCEDGILLREITLKAIIGPRDIDDPRPGIVIMLPHED